MTETIKIQQDLQGMRILMLGAFNMFTEDWMLKKIQQENNNEKTNNN